MIRQSCLAIFCGLLLAGCAEPRIDTSTKESTEQSIREVGEALPPDERDEFQKVLAEAAFTGVMQSAFTGLKPSPESLFAPFHGMTAGEAMAHAKKLKADAAAKQKEADDRIEAARLEMENEQRRRDEAELAELEAIVDAQRKDEQLLSKIRVTDPRVAEKRSHFGRDYAMSGQAFNGTDVPLSVIFAKVEARLPGRAVALQSSDVVIRIPGGVEPGESVRFADGGTSMGLILIHKAISENPGAELHVAVTGAWDAKEESIVTAHGLSEYGQNRMDELKKKLAK
jgi:hypothetical protein